MSMKQLLKLKVGVQLGGGEAIFIMHGESSLNFTL